MEYLLTQLLNPNGEALTTIADTILAVDTSLQTIGVALYDYNTMLSAIKTTVENLTNFSIAIVIITSLSLIVNAVLAYKVVKMDHKINGLNK